MSFGDFKKDFLKQGIPWRLVLPFILGVVLLLLMSMRGNESTEAEALPSELEKMCTALDGVNSCSVMVTYKDAEKQNEVLAVAVIYSGDGGVRTEAQIKELIISLYGIGANRVAVISQK